MQRGGQAGWLAGVSSSPIYRLYQPRAGVGAGYTRGSLGLDRPVGTSTSGTHCTLPSPMPLKVDHTAETSKARSVWVLTYAFKPLKNMDIYIIHISSRLPLGIHYHILSIIKRYSVNPGHHELILPDMVTNVVSRSMSRFRRACHLLMLLLLLPFLLPLLQPSPVAASDISRVFLRFFGVPTSVT